MLCSQDPKLAKVRRVFKGALLSNYDVYLRTKKECKAAIEARIEGLLKKGWLLYDKELYYDPSLTRDQIKWAKSHNWIQFCIDNYDRLYILD